MDASSMSTWIQNIFLYNFFAFKLEPSKKVEPLRTYIRPV